MSKIKFQIGDAVEWEPASGAPKDGIVEAVIAAGALPTPTQRKECDAYGAARLTVSYLVRVPPKTGRGKGKLYWPIAGSLRPRDVAFGLAHRALEMVDGNLHVTSVLSLDNPVSIAGFSQLKAILQMAYDEGLRAGALRPHAALQKLSRGGVKAA
ncbi:hypothetical protein ABIC83_002894 [Roseateles asaccharophilus]|uniref:hypothetical protein n=1 Tax=Roseateles asaccharophilus TaxID=582607 RepID=UPI003834BCCB